MLFNEKQMLCKKKLTHIKRIAGILGMLLIFCKIAGILNYIYVPDDNWTRILWHNFYEDDGKIDNIYLGTSHVYCGINPMQLDKINGQYNFNLASSSQSLNGAYYLLKEADRNNSLSNVYLELYYMCNTKDNFNADKDWIDVDYSVNWRNTDYMKVSYNKFKYMLSIAGAEKYVDIFFPFSRYRTKLGDWNHIKYTTEFKRTDKYLDFEFYNEYSDKGGYYEYKEQGYHYSTREFRNEQRLFGQSRILGKNPIGEESEKYLRKIIIYCQKRDIPFTLFVAPMDELQIISTEHYDNYVNQIKEIAAEYNVPFYDFNLAKEEYLPIHQGKYFADSQHLNGAGASMFTTFFSEVVSGNPLENVEFFYTSYEEKLQNIEPAIYGLYYRDSGGFRTYHIASNRDEGMEYRIMLKPVQDNSGGGIEQVVVQDFAGNKEFALPADEHGVCTIEARITGEPVSIQVLTVNY